MASTGSDLPLPEALEEACLRLTGAKEGPSSRAQPTFEVFFLAVVTALTRLAALTALTARAARGPAVLAIAPVLTIKLATSAPAETGEPGEIEVSPERGLPRPDQYK